MCPPGSVRIRPGHNRHSGANVERDGPDLLEFGNTDLETKRSGVGGTGDDRRRDPRVVNPENDSVHSHHRWNGISPQWNTRLMPGIVGQVKSIEFSAVHLDVGVDGLTERSDLVSHRQCQFARRRGDQHLQSRRRHPPIANARARGLVRTGMEHHEGNGVGGISRRIPLCVRLLFPLEVFQQLRGDSGPRSDDLVVCEDNRSKGPEVRCDIAAHDGAHERTDDEHPTGSQLQRPWPQRVEEGHAGGPEKQHGARGNDVELFVLRDKDEGKVE